MLGPLLGVHEADALLVALRSAGFPDVRLQALVWEAPLELLTGMIPLYQGHRREKVGLLEKKRAPKAYIVDVCRALAMALKQIILSEELYLIISFT